MTMLNNSSSSANPNNYLFRGKLLERVQNLCDFRSDANAEIETLKRKESVAVKKLQDMQKRGMVMSSSINNGKNNLHLVDSATNTSFELGGMAMDFGDSPVEFKKTVAGNRGGGPTNPRHRYH